MTTDHSEQPPYRVLVPVSDNETSAQAQARFVAALPHASTSVETTLTHVMHGIELDTSRTLRSTQRVGTVMHARDYLRENNVAVEIMDAGDPYPPTESILALADEINADLIVLGGGTHGLLDDLLTGNVSKSVGKRTSRPITIVSAAPADVRSDA